MYEPCTTIVSTNDIECTSSVLFNETSNFANSNFSSSIFIDSYDKVLNELQSKMSGLNLTHESSQPIISSTQTPDNPTLNFNTTIPLRSRLVSEVKDVHMFNCKSAVSDPSKTKQFPTPPTRSSSGKWQPYSLKIAAKKWDSVYPTVLATKSLVRKKGSFKLGRKKSYLKFLENTKLPCIDELVQCHSTAEIQSQREAVNDVKKVPDDGFSY